MGVMITWTYNNPPYIESGNELYNDLVLAYENGAKYILVFDTNKNYTASVLEKNILRLWNSFGNMRWIILELISLRGVLFLFFQKVMDMGFVDLMIRFGDYGKLMISLLK